jgi:hypothetical protein
MPSWGAREEAAGHASAAVLRETVPTVDVQAAASRQLRAWCVRRHWVIILGLNIRAEAARREMAHNQQKLYPLRA